MQAQSKQDLYFGQLAIKRKFATRSQVEECLERQKKDFQQGKPVRRLGDIMVAREYFSKEEAEAIYKTQKRMLDSKEDNLVDQVIARYRIKSQIGKGGMGNVYNAEQISMSRPIALKILKKELAQDKTYIQRFVREARSAGTLNHTNIIQVHDVGNFRGLYYFSMELISGKNVQEIIDEQGTIKPRAALKIIMDIAKALEHAAKHDIIHRDIKPENIMITQDGLTKLADLGLAKKTSTPEEAMVTQAVVAMGTPFYMSPEQAADSRSVDQRSDIFSLGASFYHMLTGKVPFRGKTVLETLMKLSKDEPIPPKQIVSTIPMSYCQVIKKMMAKNVDARYQSATELLHDLKKLGERKTLGLPKDQVAAKARLARMRAKRMRKRLMIAAPVVLIAAVIMFFILTQNPDNPPTQPPPASPQDDTGNNGDMDKPQTPTQPPALKNPISIIPTDIKAPFQRDYTFADKKEMKYNPIAGHWSGTPNNTLRGKPDPTSGVADAVVIMFAGTFFREYQCDVEIHGTDGQPGILFAGPSTHEAAKTNPYFSFHLAKNGKQWLIRRSDTPQALAIGGTPQKAYTPQKPFVLSITKRIINPDKEICRFTFFINSTMVHARTSSNAPLSYIGLVASRAPITISRISIQGDPIERK